MHPKLDRRRGVDLLAVYVYIYIYSGLRIRNRRMKQPKLLDQVRQSIRMKHYSPRTEEAYIDWIKRFILFHKKRHPKDMGAKEVGEFLTWLAVKQPGFPAFAGNDKFCGSSPCRRGECFLHISSEFCVFLVDFFHYRFLRRTFLIFFKKTDQFFAQIVIVGMFQQHLACTRAW